MESLPFSMPAVLRKIHTALTGGTFSSLNKSLRYRPSRSYLLADFTEKCMKQTCITVDLHWKRERGLVQKYKRAGDH